MDYNTLILSTSDEDLEKAAELLKKGLTVGIPTETVYGLAADAFNERAVSEIYKAKGRPSDNPLIVHIGEYSDIYNLVREIPANAVKLADAFWPGPLTMVLPKKDCIPAVTSGGLDTVGIRFPAHKTAREIIGRCGRPLAAPSANLSGSPSPTSAAHVYSDLKGRIPAVVDGGDCAVGLESTVVCFDSEGRAVILRPGFVSAEDMQSELGADKVVCARGVTEEISEGEKVLSPGIKYKHYSPKANVTILCGSIDSFISFVQAHNGDKTVSMIFDSDKDKFPFEYVTFGDSSEEQARQLFSVLRRLDETGAEQVYARCPEKTGVGLAVYNRLLRAAGFEVIYL